LQGLGSILVESIQGSWDNVVGLPLKAALRLVEKVVARADDEDGEEMHVLEEEEEEEE
jgi:septum formation protein